MAGVDGRVTAGAGVSTESSKQLGEDTRQEKDKYGARPETEQRREKDTGQLFFDCITEVKHQTPNYWHSHLTQQQAEFKSSL